MQDQNNDLVFCHVPLSFPVITEIPTGKRNKHEYDREKGIIKRRITFLLSMRSRKIF
jgi:vacuolar-type H+-ATPase subunit F/Vma7